MSSDKRVNEAGWFYHAPAKRSGPKEPPLLPAASQIPGLNNLPSQPEDDPRPLFRDSDTKYIRLAKKGGREDLLRFKENPNMRERDPVHYNRSEWYYLEDNALEDAENQEKMPYAFLLPEYMVHDSYKPDGDDATYSRPKRAPYAFDTKSAYDREGDKIKDKTVKLPEVIRAGYGVRSAKPAKTKQQTIPQQQKPISAAKMSQLEQEKPRLKYLPLPTEDKVQPKMSKLLSYEYDRQWHDGITKWQSKQDRLRDKFRAMATDPANNEPLASEYNSTFGKKVQQPYKQEKRKVWETKPKKDVFIDTSQIAVQGNDLFKMNKFKNVHSKIDSHMAKEVLAAAQ